MNPEALRELVFAIVSCAIDGGIWHDSYNVVRGTIDKNNKIEPANPKFQKARTPSK